MEAESFQRQVGVVCAILWSGLLYWSEEAAGAMGPPGDANVCIETLALGIAGGQDGGRSFVGNQLWSLAAGGRGGGKGGHRKPWLGEGGGVGGGGGRVGDMGGGFGGGGGEGG